MLGIVVLNYNTWEETEQCIRSILDTVAALPYRIVLVDNGSLRACPTSLESLVKEHDITFFKNGKNLGYSAGNNVGISHARTIGCNSILITNNDVVFLPGSIENLQASLEHRVSEKVGIVGPKILRPDRSLDTQNYICRRTGMKERYQVRTVLKHMFRRAHISYYGLDKDLSSAFPVYSVSGCCFIMSGACADAITPFDERVFLYNEEQIIGIRMEESGFRTIYDPSCEIIHAHGKSTSRIRAQAFSASVKSDIFYSKVYLHASTAAIFPLYLNSVCRYLARALFYKEYRTYFKAFLSETGKDLLQSP